MLLRKKTTDTRPPEERSKKHPLADRIAPPLTEKGILIRPLKLTVPETVLDRKVKLIGKVGDSDWSRMHRIAKPKA